MAYTNGSGCRVAAFAASGLITVSTLRRLRSEVAANDTRDTRACVLDFSRVVWALSDTETHVEMMLFEPQRYHWLSGAWVVPTSHLPTFRRVAVMFAQKGIARRVFTDCATALAWAHEEAQLPPWEDDPAHVAERDKAFQSFKAKFTGLIPLK